LINFLLDKLSTDHLEMAGGRRELRVKS